MKSIKIKTIILFFISAVVLLQGTTVNALESIPENYAVCSVELFTVGGGYLVYPTKIDVSKEQTAAEYVTRLLYENGYSAYYSGSFNDSYYLAYIGSGTRKSRYNGYMNSTAVYGENKSAKNLIFESNIPGCVKNNLSGVKYFYENDDKNYPGFIGEFMYTNTSGFLYSLNNSFLSKSLGQVKLRGGDVLRVQYTLSNGVDIGGLDKSAESSLSQFYPVANKDSLTALLAEVKGDNLNIDKALAAVQRPDISQSEIDMAHFELSREMNNKTQDAPEPNTTQPVSTAVKETETAHTTQPHKNDATEQTSQANPSSAPTENVNEKTEITQTASKTETATKVTSSEPTVQNSEKPAAEIGLEICLSTNDTAYKLLTAESGISAEEVFLYTVIGICIIAIIVYIIFKRKGKLK